MHISGRQIASLFLILIALGGQVNMTRNDGEVKDDDYGDGDVESKADVPRPSERR